MYTITSTISSGSYGRVFGARRGDEIVAIKEFKVGQKKHSIIGAINLKEVDHLRRCVHPFILKPIAITYTRPYKDPSKIVQETTMAEGYSKRLSDDIYIIMPMAEMSLFSFIGKKYKHICTVPLLKRFMVQITHALAYLHQNRICYRDVKSLNVLIFRDETYSDAYNAVLCDMGMCKPITPNQLNSEHVGTPTYKAPEIVMSPGNYSYPVDVWSLGVLFMEIFNKSNPFDRELSKKKTSDLEVLKKIFYNRGSPDVKTFNKLTKGGNTDISYSSISKCTKHPISDLFDLECKKLALFEEVSEGLPNFGTLEEFIDLLEKMMVVDPDGRIRMTDILKHPFFSQVPKEENGMWRGLKNPDLEPPVYHVLKRIENDELRDQGIKVISKISLDYSREIMLRAMFLGIDLYDRCLLKAQEIGKELDPGLLAFSCCYMACKYFMDEGTPHLSVIFPKTHEYEVADIVNMEKTILIELIDWQIYRITVFDLLEDKSGPVYLSKLLKVPKDGVYGHDIQKVLKGFEKWREGKK